MTPLLHTYLSTYARTYTRNKSDLHLEWKLRARTRHVWDHAFLLLKYCSFCNSSLMHWNFDLLSLFGTHRRHSKHRRSGAGWHGVKRHSRFVHDHRQSGQGNNPWTHLRSSHVLLFCVVLCERVCECEIVRVDFDVLFFVLCMAFCLVCKLLYVYVRWLIALLAFFKSFMHSFYIYELYRVYLHNIPIHSIIHFNICIFLNK